MNKKEIKAILTEFLNTLKSEVGSYRIRDIETKLAVDTFLKEKKFNINISLTAK